MEANSFYCNTVLSDAQTLFFNGSLSDFNTTYLTKSGLTKINVKKFKVIDNKVVICTFDDGTIEKAVCNDNDTFSLEQGVSICICKKLLGGSNTYNKTINKIIKDYNRKENELKAKKAEEERIKLLKQKSDEKKAKYFERKRKQQEERQIEIQKEAYIRAMREVNNQYNRV